MVAQAEARRLGYGYIGTEHILLGLANVEEGLAPTVLEELGATAPRIEERLSKAEKSGEATEGQLPVTPRGKKILELALREAMSLGHNYIGTEHILLGLVRESSCSAYKILLSLDVDDDAVRNAVIRHLARRRKPLREAQEEPHQPPPERIEVEEQQGDKESEESDEEELGGEELEAIPTHPDRPAVYDELGRARLASVLGERIRRASDEDTEAPVETWLQRHAKARRDRRRRRDKGSFLVHVHAPWGAGKSSLLNFLGTDLRNRAGSEKKGWLNRSRNGLRIRKAKRPVLSQWVVVEFSAWRHQRLVPPWWWLLASVHRSCARELWHIHRGRWLWFWVRDFAWRLWNARVVAGAALLAVGFAGIAWRLNWFGLPNEDLTSVQVLVLTGVSAIGLITGIIEMIRGTARWLAIGSAEGAVRFLRRSHDPLKVYRRRFRWLVRSSGRPLAVFIDDLDRCRPEYVVELLEGIQTLFVDDPVTYVVAADRTWLCSSFVCAYDEFQDGVGQPGRSLGHLFLEKTFQISVEIPPMSDTDHEQFWRRLMQGEDQRDGDLISDDTLEAELRDRFSRASSQVEVEQEIVNLIETGADEEKVRAAGVRRLNAPELRDVEQAQLADFAPLLEKNPRSMKRLMNAYGIERDRLLREGYLLTRSERRRLTLLTIFRLRWPDLAEHLRRNPKAVDLLFGENGEPAPEDPFASLYDDPELCEVLEGKGVKAKLDARALLKFPDRPSGQSEITTPSSSRGSPS